MELSISLLVLSLLMGGALVMATDILTQKKVETTQEKLAVVQQALKDYAERNGKLPCPASREDTLGDATYGRAVLADCEADSSVPAGTLRADNGGVYTRIGAVPTRDLLIRDDYMRDEFGSQFTYAVAEVLTSSDEYLDAGGSITLNDGTGVNISETVGFVVLSHGKDAKGAHGEQTGALKVACGASTNLDVENCDADHVFTDTPYNDGQVAAKYYDDSLVYMGKNPDAAVLTCAGFRIDSAYVIQSETSGDIDNDGFNDYLIVTNSADTFGKLHVIFGSEDGIAPTPFDLTTINGTNGFTITGISARSGIGLNLVKVLDVNNDAYMDIVISQRRATAWGSSDNTHVIFGRARGSWAATATVSSFADGTNGFKLTSEDAYGVPRGFVSGDINDDGIKDLIVGYWSGGSYQGRAYVVFGMNSGWAANLNLSSLNGTAGFYVTMDTVNMGLQSIASGDINNDDIDDVIIGARSNMYVLFGKNSAWSNHDLTVFDGTQGFLLTDSVDRATNTAAVADVNHDGYDDIITTSRFAGGGGAPGHLYVIYGKGAWSASQTFSSLTNGTNGFYIASNVSYLYWGETLSIGDINNDGETDFLVASEPGHYTYNRSYHLLGKSSWPASTGTAALLSGVNGFEILGNATYGQAYGNILADINGDDFDDMTIGNTVAVGGLYHRYGTYGRAGVWRDSYADATVLSSICGEEAVDGPDINIPNGLLAYWKMEEASGSRTDSKGSLTLTDNNTVTSAAGKQGNAASFASASTEYLSADAGTTFNFGTGDYTFQAWIKPTSVASRQHIFSKDSNVGTPGRQFFLALTENGAGNIRFCLMRADNASSCGDSPAGVVTAGAWNHVVGMRSGSIFKVYVNGVPQALTYFGQTMPQTMSAAPTLLTIGRRQYTTAYDHFNGEIDEVAVWQRALNNAEVYTLYNSGAGLSYDQLDDY